MTFFGVKTVDQMMLGNSFDVFTRIKIGTI